APPRHLFPTRRSSDLATRAGDRRWPGCPRGLRFAPGALTRPALRPAGHGPRTAQCPPEPRCRGGQGLRRQTHMQVGAGASTDPVRALRRDDGISMIELLAEFAAWLRANGWLTDWLLLLVAIITARSEERRVGK